MTEGNAGPPVRLAPEEAQRIREQHFLDNLPNAVFSTLFLCQIAEFWRQRILDTSEIADEIRSLEGVDGPTNTKPAGPLERPPLRGLWHKHFFNARFMAKNIANYWEVSPGKGRKLQHMIDEEGAAEESGRFTDDLINRMSARVTDGYMLRAEAGELTGEWIVFAKHEGKRYYLLIGQHGDDQLIHRQLVEWCKPEFPFLTWG
jgi:hypothetical protein